MGRDETRTGRYGMGCGGMIRDGMGSQRVSDAHQFMSMGFHDGPFRFGIPESSGASANQTAGLWAAGPKMSVTREMGFQT